MSDNINGSTLSVRITSDLRKRFRRKARLQGKTESELLRDMLNRELEPGKRAEKLKALAGSLSLQEVKLDDWSKTIRENNWRR